MTELLYHFPVETLSTTLSILIPHQNYPEKLIKINQTWLGLTPEWIGNGGVMPGIYINKHPNID